MKTVKPLLTIGAAFLINTITQYIVDASTAAANLPKTDEVDLTDEALGKIGLTAATLKNKVKADLTSVEAALVALKDLNDDDQWNALMSALDAELQDKTKKLTEAEKGLIKAAVRNAVTEVKEEAALLRINLTPANLRKRLNINNLATVEEALNALEGLKGEAFDAQLKRLIDLLNEGLKVDEGERAKMPDISKDKKNALTADDRVLIKEAFRKAVTEVTNEQPWKRLADTIAKETKVKIGKINLTDLQLWHVAAKKMVNVTDDLKNVTGLEDAKRVEVNKIGAKELNMTQWQGIFKLATDAANLAQVAAFNNHTKSLVKPTVTAAANGMYFSLAIMLAPLAAWFFF